MCDNVVKQNEKVLSDSITIVITGSAINPYIYSL